MCMRWKTIDKAEAELIVKKWGGKPPEEYDPDYREIRTELIQSLHGIASELNIGIEDIRKEAYQFDFRYGLELYRILSDKYKMSLRTASDDGVWRYLSIRVIPDVVYLRWDLNESRFWKDSNRVWLKTLWWYIHLSWQGDYLRTYNVLKDNTTDEIVQMVERSGRSGYRIELCRKIFEYYGQIPAQEKKGAELFRKVLKLNTARVKVIEPALVRGGETEYVKELFSYFGQK